MCRPLAPLVVSALVGLGSSMCAVSARADEPELVHFAYDAPPGCPSEAEFVAAGAELGARFREDPTGELSRKITVFIDPPPDAHGANRFSGKLTVRDRAEAETSRAVEAADCGEVARSLALFVALALEDPAPTPQVYAALEPRPFPFTASAEAPKPAPPRSTAGGLAVGAVVSGSLSGTSRAVHAFGAAHVFGATRMGAAIAFGGDDFFDADASHGITEGSGYSGRGGLLLGWAAPWTDSVAGFMMEAGVRGGGARGTSHRPSGTSGSFAMCASSLCTDDPGAPTKWSFIGPYVSWSLVLQIPAKIVRPFIALGGMIATDYRGEASFAMNAELGVAWKAW